MDLQQVRKMIQGSFDKQLKIHLPYAIESGPEMLERTRLMNARSALALACLRRMEQVDIDRACAAIGKNGQRLEDFVIEAYELKVATEKCGVAV